MKTYPRVIELLQAEVKRLGSVNKVALATHLTNNTIDKYLQGISEPQLETLEKLSRYFKCTVAWLRVDTDDKTMPAEPKNAVSLSSLDPELQVSWHLLQQLPPEKRKKSNDLLRLILTW